jgi:hypothetical protein
MALRNIDEAETRLNAVNGAKSDKAR